MLNNNSSSSYENRNLSEVFRELQNVKNITTNKKKNFDTPIFNSKLEYSVPTRKFSLVHIITIFIILFILTALLGKNIFAKSSVPEYEVNENILDIQSIISKNADISKFKEQFVANCNVVFPTISHDNSTLPKGETVVTKEGVLGKEAVTYIRTYEKQKLVDEIVLSRITLSHPVAAEVDVGTSEFLANHKVHIGDTMYLNSDYTLKKSDNKNSKDVTNITKYMDVKLIDLPSEQWCKVSYEDKEGYIESSILTSEATSPEIVEENKLQKIFNKVNIDMDLNKSSGLSEEDFKKALTNLSQDKKNIIKDNYKVFYDMDKKYNINGIFLTAIAIHESAWGTSTIANDKKNLFGYGAYDNSPYESSYSFTEYSNGIETVAKALAKYYLNPAGTELSTGETSTGAFYTEPTVKGVNKKYATDPEWHTKVFKYMELIYNTLKNGDN